jgi:hypothetical protein
VKLTTHFPRSIMVELYLQFLARHHGMVLNLLCTSLNYTYIIFAVLVASSNLMPSFHFMTVMRPKRAVELNMFSRCKLFMAGYGDNL